MKSVAVIVVLLIFYGFYSFYYHSRTAIPELPDIWWGPGSNESADSSIRPFKIIFSDKDIEDLKMRLKNTRTLTPALQGTGWSYGVDGSYLPNILEYWRTKYDFKKREKYLNRYPQFKTNIQGLDIHYIHAKGEKSAIGGKRILPLLMQHGWPGSIVEFHKILKMLITPRAEHDFVFEVIAPSLPGFGFSDSAIKPGLGGNEIAVVLKNLMLRLGYKKFYTQGGDWGAIVTAKMAALFPQNVLGIHSNMCAAINKKNLLKTFIYSIAPSLFLSEEDQRRMFPLKNRLYALVEESGYFHIHATKPDTVGVGPSDSPAALAAYVLEKFASGTNPSNKYKNDGALFEKFEADELIDNLMMYWIPNSMTTSMRIYAESYTLKARSLGLDSIPIVVPSACARFPHEIIHQPVDFLKERYTNLISATVMPRGGHFAALEEPTLLADDIWNAIANMERLRKAANRHGDKVNEL